jgi:hypothetical protein
MLVARHEDFQLFIITRAAWVHNPIVCVCMWVGGWVCTQILNEKGVEDLELIFEDNQLRGCVLSPDICVPNTPAVHHVVQ